MTELNSPRLFNPENSVSIAILEHWEDLLENKGDRAELRRCKNLEKIQISSAFQRHYKRLIIDFNKNNEFPSKEQMAIIIALAAYINENHSIVELDGKEKTDFFGYQLAKSVSQDNKKPKLSELRFRRLLKTNDREKLFRFLIQVIRLLDKKVNILDLLSIAYFWGEKTKTNLAYKYYEKAHID